MQPPLSTLHPHFTSSSILLGAGGKGIKQEQTFHQLSTFNIPDDAKKEILNFDVLGEELYETFVLERFAQTSKMKVWDSIKLAKTKTMSTWMKKIEIKIDDKVIKLREERHSLARFLII